MFFYFYVQNAGLHVDYIIVQLDILVQCSRHICLRMDASNWKCMYTSAPGSIVDCSSY